MPPHFPSGSAPCLGSGFFSLPAFESHLPAEDHLGVTGAVPVEGNTGAGACGGGWSTVLGNGPILPALSIALPTPRTGLPTPSAGTHLRSRSCRQG